MSAAVATAYAKPYEAAKVFEHFAEDHSLATAVFVTVIAIGVLLILAPLVVEALGLESLGLLRVSVLFLLRYDGRNPRADGSAGTWAAVWQSTYRGFVPKTSLFSYLQRLGMTWK